MTDAGSASAYCKFHYTFCSLDLAEEPIRHVEEPLQSHLIVHGIIRNKGGLVRESRVYSIAVDKDFPEDLVEAVGRARMADLEVAGRPLNKRLRVQRPGRSRCCVL